ncbi:hypothetical protein Tco_0764274 [Tanacetum coccineum]
MKVNHRANHNWTRGKLIQVAKYNMAGLKHHSSILLVDTQEESYVDNEESTREWIICAISLTEVTQRCHITDCHVGNPCAHTCDLTVDREYPMIGLDPRAKRQGNV